MAKEIKQRMVALFAVLGVCIFFWFSFHQNGQSLSVYARDYVNTTKVAPEIWQAVNPFFVIVEDWQRGAKRYPLLRKSS